MAAAWGLQNCISLRQLTSGEHYVHTVAQNAHFASKVVLCCQGVVLLGFEVQCGARITSEVKECHAVSVRCITPIYEQT